MGPNTRIVKFFKQYRLTRLSEFPGLECVLSLIRSGIVARLTAS